MPKILIKLVLIPVGFVASCFIMIFASLVHGRQDLNYFLPAALATTVAIIAWLLALYEMWSGLQDGQARTTPVKAVALMLIPIFNLYWLFQVVWGFAKDYNLYLARHKLSYKHLNETLFLLFCVLTVLSVVPYFGFLISLLNMVLFCFLIPQIAHAVANLQTWQDKARLK